MVTASGIKHTSFHVLVFSLQHFGTDLCIIIKVNRYFLVFNELVPVVSALIFSFNLPGFLPVCGFLPACCLLPFTTEYI